MYKEVIKKIDLLEKRKEKSLSHLKIIETEISVINEELKKLSSLKSAFEKANDEAITLLRNGNR